jgi:hypothetical protein
MRTMGDVETMAVQELTHWQQRNVMNPFAKCYLWFQPTTAERDGGFLAAEDCPGEGYEPVVPTALSGAPCQIVQDLKLRGILGRLPILAKGD